MPKISARPHIELAITGEGISPANVDILALARLLASAGQLLTAVAAWKKIDLPSTFLKGVFKGSAAFRLQASDPKHDAVFERLSIDTHELVRTRGVHAPHSVSKALIRLYRTQLPGPIRLAPRNTKLSLRAIQMAEPLPSTAKRYASTTVLHGELIGLELVGDRLDVHMRIQGSTRVKLRADVESRGRLRGLLFENVKVVAAVTRDETGMADERTWVLTSAQRWQRRPLTDALADVRRELAKGERFDPVAWESDIYDGETE